MDKTEIQKNIDEVFEIINADQSEYDKQLLTLSSGFLAVSLAFIKDVVPLKEAEFLWSLYASFIFLGLCILLVLFSYQFSIWGHFKVKQYWDNLVNEKETKFPTGHANLIKWVNRSSGVSFSIGVVFLVFFVIVNLSNEANMSNKRVIAMDGQHIKIPSCGEKIERGANIKIPPPPPPSVAPKTNTQGSGNTTQSSKP